MTKESTYEIEYVVPTSSLICLKAANANEAVTEFKKWLKQQGLGDRKIVSLRKV